MLVNNLRFLPRLIVSTWLCPDLDSDTGAWRKGRPYAKLCPWKLSTWRRRDSSRLIRKHLEIEWLFAPVCTLSNSSAISSQWFPQILSLCVIVFSRLWHRIAITCYSADQVLNTVQFSDVHAYAKYFERYETYIQWSFEVGSNTPPAMWSPE